MIWLLLSPAADAAQFEDVGLELPNDPYTHNSALTSDRMDRFLTLYVDPDEFAGSVQPAEALPVPEPPAPPEVEVRINLDAGLLDAKALDVAAVQSALESAGHVVTLDGETLVLTTAAAGGIADLAVKAAVDADPAITVKDLATIQMPEVAPVPAVEAQPERGDLVVHNETTGWAEVTINGQKVGKIGPLTEARIGDVKSGIYEIGFKLSNGFAWSERVTTE